MIWFMLYIRFRKTKTHHNLLGVPVATRITPKLMWRFARLCEMTWAWNRANSSPLDSRVNKISLVHSPWRGKLCLRFLIFSTKERERDDRQVGEDGLLSFNIRNNQRRPLFTTSWPWESRRQRVHPTIGGDYFGSFLARNFKSNRLENSNACSNKFVFDT